MARIWHSGDGGDDGWHREEATPGTSGKPIFTNEQIAQYLVSGYWAQRSFPVQSGDELTVRIDGLTAEGQQLARWAMEAWTQTTGIIFVEITTGAPDILFTDNDQSGAYSTSTISSGDITFSRVNIPTSWLDANGTTIDSYSMQTYIHEMGHAIGLGHAGPYNGAAFYNLDALYENDSWQATVMSYFSQLQNPYINASFAYVVTPMIADIIAVQSIYGGSTTTHLGDTIYGFGSNAGGYLEDLFNQLYGAAPADPSIYSGAPVTFTIHDDGGIDTLDFSTVSDNQTLNLGAGTISDVGGLRGNLSISSTSDIENGTTGSGNDTINGNDLNNVLISGAGIDRINGLGGDDDIEAGAHLDIVNGGSGNDFIDGDGGVDILIGGSENDLISGGDGNDWLIGGADNDRLVGDAGDDTMIGGGGADTFEFTATLQAENDTIRDFQDGIDQIEITNATGINDLQITYDIGGANVVMQGLDIRVVGAAQDSLTEDDFGFQLA